MIFITINDLTREQETKNKKQKTRIKKQGSKNKEQGNKEQRTRNQPIKQFKPLNNSLRMKRFIKEWFFQKWYWFVSKTDKNAEVLFMNFGFQGEKSNPELSSDDEKNRYSIQLYHQLATFGALKDKNICEVGCGRGGGLSYIHRIFNPNSSLGIDLNPIAVNFCNDFYKTKGLSFMQGDAQALPINSETFDFVLNVESSHRYPEFDKFISEVYRALKPGGHLLITDFRFSNEMESTKDIINQSGFEVVHTEIINSNVVNALKADDGRRRDLVKRLVPRLLRSTALNFAGAVGSETYNRFSENKYIYFNYVLRKN
jgi:SAM-dependent methyltransferase